MTIPSALVRSYVRMMPILRAEESIQAADRTAVGMVMLEADSRERILDGWHRQATRRPLIVGPDEPAAPVRRVRVVGNFPMNRVVVAKTAPAADHG